MMNKKYGRFTLILLTASLLLYLPLSAQKSAQVKELSGFSIRFQASLEGKVNEAVITMPNGVFSAKKK
jgi:hypothetical protein